MESQIYDTPDDIIHGNGARVSTHLRVSRRSGVGEGTRSPAALEKTLKEQRLAFKIKALAGEGPGAARRG